MIRRHHQKYGVLAVFDGPQRGQRDSGRRVATLRLEDDPPVHFDTGKLLSHRKSVRLVADDQAMIGRFCQAANTHRRGLQHRALLRQRQKLLRIHRARRRPKARAGTTGENDREDPDHD